MEGLESSMKVKEQPIEEIKRLCQEVDKLRQEKTERKKAEERKHTFKEVEAMNTKMETFVYTSERLSPLYTHTALFSP